MSGNHKNSYFAPDKSSAFYNLSKLALASPGTKCADLQTWLLKLDSYTLHRPVRKKLIRNPYNVTNISDVWETDLMDIQNFSKYNDGYRYLLSVIDVFSNFFTS
jgi:hypothetical protein